MNPDDQAAAEYNQQQESVAAKWFAIHTKLIKDQATLTTIYTETTDIDLLDILRDADRITELKASIKFLSTQLGQLEYHMAVMEPVFDPEQYNITPIFNTRVSIDNYFRKELQSNSNSRKDLTTAAPKGVA